jgi:hypothetical protein
MMYGGYAFFNHINELTKNYFNMHSFENAFSTVVYTFFKSL